MPSVPLLAASRRRPLACGLLALTCLALTPVETASAQWFGFGRNRCQSCSAPPPSYSYAPAYTPAYSTAYGGDACGCTQSVAAAPVVQQTACVAVQPVRQTVYQQVPVTKYKQVARTERRPVYKTAYEDREVTVMQQVTEQRTAMVPYTAYQSVTEYQPRTQDRSHWRTVYRPNYKPCPTQYDCRPGFAGWWGRTRQDLRNAFTPDRVASRQFVPDVRTSMVPVTRQVPITAQRAVTYSVAKMVPVKTKQRVAVLRQEYEDVPVTAWEPYTTTETVAVGTQTRLVYAPLGGTTATAAAPTPARTAAEERPVQRKADAGNGQQANKDPFQLNNYSPEESSRPSRSMRADGHFELPQTEPREPSRLNVELRQRGRSTQPVQFQPTAEPRPATPLRLGQSQPTNDDPRMRGFRPRRRDVAVSQGWDSRQSPAVLQTAGWQPVRSRDAGPRLDLAMNAR